VQSASSTNYRLPSVLQRVPFMSAHRDAETGQAVTKSTGFNWDCVRVPAADSKVTFKCAIACNRFFHESR